MTFLTLLIRVTVGIFSRRVGICGGILFVPALACLYGMGRRKAQGSSIGTLLALMGLLAWTAYYREDNIGIRGVGLLPVGFLQCGYFGTPGEQIVSDVLSRRISIKFLVGL